MANEVLIRDIVTRACCDALQQKSQEFAEEVARRASEELAKTGERLSLQSSPAEAPGDRMKELLDGALSIVGSRTQTETLEAVLAAVSPVTPECGLMILRGTQASGWSCKGLAKLEIFKQTAMDCSEGVAARVINSCAAAAAQVCELDPDFRDTLGLESSARLLLVPILLKGRVAALLIARPQQSEDLAALELMVQITQLSLELQALRKAAPQEPEPVYAETAAAGAPAAPLAEAAEIALSNPVSIPSAGRSAAPQLGQPLPGEVHEKARRFAKLLVEEIRLYNQAKLAEGRARGDLYSRLRDDIEKSRGAYQKRYGESVKEVDYFTQELLRILVDNNRAMMGPDFPS